MVSHIGEKERWSAFHNSKALPGMRQEEGTIDQINCPLFFKSRYPIWQDYRLSLRHGYLGHVDVLIISQQAIRLSKGADLRWYSWHTCAWAEDQVLICLPASLKGYITQFQTVLIDLDVGAQAQSALIVSLIRMIGNSARFDIRRTLRVERIIRKAGEDLFCNGVSCE
jgi:hypothetical protein